MLFGDRLRELRTERGLSQDDLAQAMGYTKTAISQYELGKRVPSYPTLTKMAAYFGVTTDWLLGRTDRRRSVLHGSEEEAAPDTPKSAAQRRIYDVAARAGQLPPDKIDQIADAMDAIMRMIEGPDANKHDGKKGGTERT